jgi:hypothetical protein
MRGGAEDADTAVGVLDDGKDVLALPGQGDGLDEVAGEQRFGLGAQEVGPRCAAALGRGVDARALEDLPDGGGGDLDTERGELAVHPPVPPARILPDQAQDEGPDGADGRRASGPLGSAGARVPPTHQIAVPAQDGVRSHQQPQAAQHLTGQRREEGGEEGTVFRREPHPVGRHPVGAELSLQDGDLMP